MKVLLAIPGADGFVGFKEIAVHLHSLGHTILVAHPPAPLGLEYASWYLRQFQEKTGNGISVPLYGLDIKFRTLKKDVWGLINCGIYAQPDHPVRWLQARRIETDLSPFARSLMSYSLIRKLLLSKWFQSWLKWLERRFRPNRQVVEWLVKNKPDVVVVSPYVFSPFGEVEYVKAAKKLGIPVIVMVASWDNLSTKGTFHYVPDITLVWNEWLANQAVKFHAVPTDSIVVTGAARFDSFFDASPSRKREDFLKLAGLRPDKPFITYLGSSNFVSKYSSSVNESIFFVKFAEALRKHPETKDISVLIRPHPNRKAKHIWQNFIPPENSVVWNFNFQTNEKESQCLQRDLFDTLLYSEAVVAMNTSGFIDAAIFNKPCISILVPDYQKGTEDLYHFRHLLEQDFLSVARDVNSAVEAVIEVLKGQDKKRVQRELFVENFTRPRSLKVPAGMMVAKAIELAGKRNSAREISIQLTRIGLEGCSL